MFAVLVTSLLCLAPQVDASVVGQVASAGAAGSAAERGAREAVEVRGTAELNQADAFAAARSAAVEHLQRRWEERGRRELVDRRPCWLPGFVAEQALRRWLDRQPITSTLQIVDREDRVREHEFGQSFQTTLWVAEDAPRVVAAERQLRRELAATERRALLAVGGTAAAWAVLAVAVSWLDRLSRGYMSGRLRLIGLLLGAAAPCLAFLL